MQFILAYIVVGGTRYPDTELAAAVKSISGIVSGPAEAAGQIADRVYLDLHYGHIAIGCYIGCGRYLDLYHLIVVNTLNGTWGAICRGRKALNSEVSTGGTDRRAGVATVLGSGCLHYTCEEHEWQEFL
jgi:hypothetical protein